MLIRDQYAEDSGAWCNLNKPELSEKKVDAVIFGIPFDEGVSYRSGASEGPAVLRKNTFSSTPYTEQFESIASLKVYDAGDFQCENSPSLDPSLTAMFAARKIITECWGHRARKIGILEPL